MNLSNISRTHLVIGGIVLLALIAAIATYLYLKPSPTEEIVLTPDGEAIATSTPSEDTPRKGLPPEPAFTLPQGAEALDDYAYLMDDGVYFRSITSTEPLKIPDADAATFGRLAEFFTYTANNVQDDCGGTPIYTYYGDSKRIYFYQIWRAEHFRTSQIEVIVGAEEEDFRVTGMNTATDGVGQFEVTHKVATSTCLLTLKRTD